MQLTEHFSLEELTASDTAVRLGIDNNPPDPVLENLHILAQGLESVRRVLKNPIHINSGYRCKSLNQAVRGSKTSEHMTGLAADIICPRFGTPLEVCRAIAAAGIPFNQVIHEGQWCHVSFPSPGLAGNNELLTAHFGPTGTTYSDGLITA